MYAAMKAGDKTRAASLRSAVAALKDKKIDKREDLTEEEQIKVIQTMTKQRRESIEMYSQGGRSDLADIEKAELECLEEYLPEQMSEEKVRVLVAGIVKETGAQGMKDIGKVMPLVMKAGAGKIDGKLAQSVVRELLAG